MLKIINKFNTFVFSFLAFLFLFFLSLYTDERTSVDMQRFLQWSLYSKENSMLDTLDYLYDVRSIKGIQFFLSVKFFEFIQNYKNWELVFRIINSLVYGVTIFYVAKSFKHNTLLVSLMVFYPILNLDFTVWSQYILTDFIFACFVVILCVSLANKRFLLSSFVVTILFFIRPPGLVLLLVIIQYFFIYFFLNKFSYKIKFSIVFICYFVLALFASFIIYENIFFDELFEIFTYHRDYYLNGVIVNSREHTYVEEPSSIFDIFKIIFLRALYFFKFYDILFSFKHNIYNMFYYSVFYFFSFYCFFHFKNYSLIEQNLIFITVIMILSFTLFQSLMLIDYDWRYRLPIYMPLNICFVLGVSKFIKKLKIFHS
jgi:hypothetical protein